MLLTYTDLQPALNIDLTDPNGQELATALIAAAQALFSGPNYLGFPIEQAEVSEYRSGGVPRFWLDTSAPVTELSVAQRDSLANTYATIEPESVIHHGDRNVYLTVSTSDAFHALCFTYTTGWTSGTLPKDLRQAIIDTVGLKLLEVANYSSSDPAGDTEESGEGGESTSQSGALKKVTSGAYTEEYSTSGSDAFWKAKIAQLTRTIGDNLPDSITETVRAYRPVIAL